METFRDVVGHSECGEEVGMHTIGFLKKMYESCWLITNADTNVRTYFPHLTVEDIPSPVVELTNYSGYCDGGRCRHIIQYMEKLQKIA